MIPRSTDLAGEHSRGNRVHADLCLCKCGREHAGHMNGSCLGRRIGKLARGATLHHTRDGRNVDNTGSVSRRDLATFGK